MTESSTKKKLSIGAAFMVGLEFIQRFLGIITLIIMARILTPEDFGIVAVVTGIYAVVSDATRLNMGQAMIQMQNLNKNHINTAWSLNILRGILLLIIISVIALFPTYFSEIEGLGAAIAFIALLPFIESFNNSGMILFEKEMNFKPRFVNTITSKFVGFFVTLISAYILQSYWAMLIGLIATSIMTVIMSYIQCQHRPKLSFSEWRPLFSFSGWLAAANLVESISRRIAVFMVAGNISLKMAGQFNMAKELGQMVQSHITFPLLSVLYPGLSKFNQDLDLLLTNYLRARKTLISLVLPMGIGLAITANELVPLLLGSGWEIVPPILAVVSTAASLNLYTVGTDQILLALGKTKILFYRKLLGSILLITATIIGILNWGLWGMILSSLVSMLIMTLINIQLLTSTLRITSEKLARGLASPLIASLFMILCCYYLESSIDLSAMGLYLSLFLKIVLGAITYITSHIIIWLIAGKPESLETEIISVVSHHFRTRK